MSTTAALPPVENWRQIVGICVRAVLIFLAFWPWVLGWLAGATVTVARLVWVAVVIGYNDGRQGGT